MVLGFKKLEGLGYALVIIIRHFPCLKKADILAYAGSRVKYVLNLQHHRKCSTEYKNTRYIHVFKCFVQYKVKQEAKLTALFGSRSCLKDFYELHKRGKLINSSLAIALKWVT